METPKVSIIIPVYNIPEDTLRKCIQSAISQTLHEIEIILVDDGSNDQSSSKICDEMGLQDDRITVIHKENEGLAAARNTGYEASKGEWITFLDSDDYFSAEICKSCYEKGSSSNVDIVIFGTVQELGVKIIPFRYHYEDGTIVEHEACKLLQADILDFSGNIATAWAKLIRRDFLKKYNITHNAELRQGSEGIEFNIRLFEHVDKALFTSEVGYHYVYNPNSISAKHNEKNHYYVLRCFEEIKKQISISENRERLQGKFYDRIAYIVVSSAITGYFSPVNPQSYKEQIRSYQKYLEHPLIQECLAHDLSSLDRKRRLILWCIRHKQYYILRMLAKIRYHQKHT